MIALRPTLALTARTLREDTRLLRVHAVRLLFVSCILWLLYLAHDQSRRFGAPGLRFFESVCYLDLCLITLVGFGYFTSAITEEKEEQTIGLLTMADIGPTAMLIGKSVPRLFGSMLILFAQFPFTLLAVTLGGVLLHQVVAAYVALLSYLVLAAGLGLFFSVVSRTTLAASRNVVIVLGVFLAVPLLVEEAVGAPANPLTPFSPLLRIEEICRTGFAGAAVGSQAICHLAMGSLLFALSRSLFSRCVRDETTGGPTRSLFDRLGRRLRGSSGLRPRRAWGDALAWKDFYFIAGGFRWMVLKTILYPAAAIGFAVWNAALYGYYQLDELVGGTFMIGMPLALTLELSILGARTFSEEIRWQTLPTIAMLPAPLPTLAVQKVAGCLRTVAPAVAYFFLGALIYPEGIDDFFRDVLDEPVFYWFCSQCVLFVHLSTWYSLYTRWGAIPLAFGTVFLTNACCITTFETMLGYGGEDAFFALLTMATGAIVVALYFAIGTRLRSIVEK